MDSINVTQIAQMIDISAVRTDADLDEIKRVIEAARRHRFICAFAMPCFTRVLKEGLKDEPDILVGGVVGFPSGADTTRIKVETAKELVETGVNELDMVINVGALKSGEYDYVKQDIAAVVNTACGLPVKAILEVAYLTDDEIRRACGLAVEAGVSYIKTGTGWANKPTTVDTIRLIRDTVGTSVAIKAAGGVRTLDTLLEMVEAGCSRFGIGINSAEKIIEEAKIRGGNTI